MGVSFLPQITAIQYSFLSQINVGCKLSEIKEVVLGLNQVSSQAFYTYAKALEGRSLITRNRSHRDHWIQLTSNGCAAVLAYEMHCREVLDLPVGAL